MAPKIPKVEAEAEAAHYITEHEAFLKNHQEEIEAREKFHDNIEFMAGKDAVITAICSGAVASVMTVIATKRLPRFNRFMSLSAKLSLPIMTALFGYVYQYETSALLYLREPEKHGLAEGIAPEILKTEINVQPLPVYQRAMNYMYLHPFQMIAACGAPLIGGILTQQLQQKQLTFSQRIMVSRLYAQTGVLTITLLVMGFRSYMGTRGLFVADSNRKAIKETI